MHEVRTLGTTSNVICMAKSISTCTELRICKFYYNVNRNCAWYQHKYLVICNNNFLQLFLTVNDLLTYLLIKNSHVPFRIRIIIKIVKCASYTVRLCALIRRCKSDDCLFKSGLNFVIWNTKWKKYILWGPSISK